MSGDITSGGQNVRGDKRSGDETSGDKTSIWVIYNRAMLGNICLLKSLWGLEEKFTKTMHFLSVPAGGGGKHTTYLIEKYYIYY